MFMPRQHYKVACAELLRRYAPFGPVRCGGRDRVRPFGPNCSQLRLCAVSGGVFSSSWPAPPGSDDRTTPTETRLALSLKLPAAFNQFQVILSDFNRFKPATHVAQLARFQVHRVALQCTVRKNKRSGSPYHASRFPPRNATVENFRENRYILCRYDPSA